ARLRDDRPRRPRRGARSLLRRARRGADPRGEVRRGRGRPPPRRGRRPRPRREPALHLLLWRAPRPGRAARREAPAPAPRPLSLAQGGERARGRGDEEDEAGERPPAPLHGQRPQRRLRQDARAHRRARPLTSEERPLLAFAFSLAASLAFTGMSVSVRALGPAVGTPETVFFRGLAGGLLGAVIHLVARRPLHVSAPGVMLLRIITGTLSLLCYYGAIESGDRAALATANLLLKTAPVWVALGASFLLGERAGSRTWLALAVGLAGAALALLGPTGSADRSAVILGVLSGICAAGAYLSVRKLASSEDPLTVVTLFSCGIAVVLAPVV